MNKVAEPFKVTSDLMNSGGEDVSCDAIDAENLSGNSGGEVDDQLEQLVFKEDGKIPKNIKKFIQSIQIDTAI